MVQNIWKKTLSGKTLLRDYYQIYIQIPKTNILKEHLHIIYMSSFHQKLMLTSPQFYVDGTFIGRSKKFTQVIVVLYYLPLIDKKIFGSFILINSKYENAYTIAFQNFWRILKKNDELN